MIFQDSSAVDLILGLDPVRKRSGEIDFMQSVAGSEISKFIHTKDGRKLEVKRAISSWEPWGTVVERIVSIRAPGCMESIRQGSDMPSDGVRWGVCFLPISI